MPDTQGVGQTVPGGPAESVGTAFHPKTEAGQALLIAAVSFAILLWSVGRGRRGADRLIAVGEFILIVMAASLVGHYAARNYVMRHPDGAVAAGLTIDA
jgi:putative copper export protein